MALTVFLAFAVGALCLERLFYYISNRAYLLQSRKLCADVFHRHCQWYVIGVMLSAVWLVLNFEFRKATGRFRGSETFEQSFMVA